MNKTNDFKLAVLASGNGSTGEVLFPLASLVITNNPGAGVIEKATHPSKGGKNAGIPIEVVLREEKSLEDFGKELLEVLNKYQINFISQNGWEILTPENVVKEFEGRITNNHPAPLDPGHLDFGGKGMKGLAVHQAVLNFAKKVSRHFNTEIDIHLVTEEFDKGELVAKREVELKEDDTAESLQIRLKEAEKELLKDFWEKVKEEGKIEVIKGETRIILPGEEKILEEAKNEAIAQF